ncbi:CLUMA_CG000993, isoform A [Clunio marinus]|uniref:CLUMA_CG000993, isoform A n=1 Tax=Clunio marinus TaxID=568069 RepID=A0A1J1HIF9_9DIPT|nr:CLUMA_CG000993, isoform A [Clunio marinus]
MTENIIQWVKRKEIIDHFSKLSCLSEDFTWLTEEGHKASRKGCLDNFKRLFTKQFYEQLEAFAININM